MDHNIHNLKVDEYWEVALDLVEKAGKIIGSHCNERKTFKCKSGEIDLLTETDGQVEQLFINGIKVRFPNHKFIGEEQFSEGVREQLTCDPTWIIDPIDGTMNFVHNFPHSCISVALIIDKVTEFGIIYNPVLNQKFTARRGKGAFYNNNKIHVSGEKELSKALVVSEFGTSRDPEKMRVVIKNFDKLLKSAHGIRVLGSAALDMSMVALGAADACYEMGIHVWDVAAADIIIREAGGVVLDPAGGEFDLMSRRFLGASTPELAMELVKILEQYYPKPRDD